jgi:hypothetical protein
MNALCFFAALLLTLLSLATAGAADGGASKIRSLAKGAFSGIQDPRQEVLRDQKKWEELWKAHAVRSNPAPRLPEVDFTKEMVIAATMGRQRTGGYTIEITGVETTDTELKISIKRTTPPPGTMAIQALTAPFHFVAVPRSDLKPVFVEAGVAKR